MPFLATLRNALAPAGRPVRRGLGWWGRNRRRARCLRDGIAGIAAELRQASHGQVNILREYGARIGNDVDIPGPLLIVNADTDFSGLTIGNHVHVGAGTLIDLADEVAIEDYATLSMRSTIITHLDVGPGPLKERRPRQQAPVRIGRGAYLGAGATILHGVTVGAEATVGAHALVDRDVAPGTTVVAPRARLVAD